MKRLTTLAAVLLAGFALAFLSAPWFALRGVQAAARDGDVHALAELVDYEAVRQGLRARLSAVEAVPAPKVWEDPLGALSRAVQGPRTSAETIDRQLTPAGLHATVGDPQAFPQVRHWGPSRVRFAVGPGRATLLTFQRRGLLRWRLVQLHAPGLASGEQRRGDLGPR